MYLVDVSSMFFRAFYAIRPLTSPKGVPTNAIYGFLSMTVKLLKDLKPDYLAFCFDRGEPTFRHQMDERYKANRTEMPEDLQVQVPYIYKITEALGLPFFSVENYEADDVIGTLAHLGVREGLQVVIVSGDKDFGQLVSPRITMWDPMRDTTFDEKGVQDKWGVPPHLMIDFLAITGDSSDNIPGVRGLGPKGAQKLLSQYKNLEDIYEHLDEIKPPSAQKKLAECKDDAFLSKKLVTICTDVPINFSLDDLRLKKLPGEELRQLLEELGFKTFIAKLLGEDSQVQVGQFHPTKEISGNNVEVAATDLPEIVEKMVSAKKLRQWLQERAHVWILSTDRGSYFSDEKEIVGCLEGEHGLCTDLSLEHIQWQGFDLKKSWHQMDLNKGEALWDSELAAYNVKGGSVSDFRTTYQEFTGKTLPEFARPSRLLNAHLELKAALSAKIQELSMDRILVVLDLPMVSILHRMERIGIHLETEYLKDMSRALGEEIKSLESEIHKLAGTEFNVASTKQLGEVLFEKMNLPKGRKTKTGYSTDSDVLAKLAEEHPIAAKVLEYRELAKLKSTYTDTLVDLVNPQTGRLHTVFSQTATTTGRLSSSNPNLQNIPIRTERGRKIRGAFRAAPGKLLLSADYSQIELRVLAHISGDLGLIKAFERDLDIHAATASEIFETPLEQVTPEQRRRAKAVNFGIAYGQGVFGLSETLQIPREEAAAIIKRYFERFPKVREYMEQVVVDAKERGYVQTLFGRRRNLPELRSSSPMQKRFGERAAINAPIQGTASDIVKLAMVEVSDGVPGDLLLQVHDELLFEVLESEVEQAAAAIKEKMENCADLAVKLKVNVAWGKTWEEAHA